MTLPIVKYLVEKCHADVNLFIYHVPCQNALYHHLNGHGKTAQLKIINYLLRQGSRLDYLTLDHLKMIKKVVKSFLIEKYLPLLKVKK